MLRFDGDCDLRLGPDVTITGGGTLLTDPESQTAHVTIRPLSGQPQAHLSLGATIRGRVTVKVHLRNNGLILADKSSDVITIGDEGTCETPIKVSGSGEFRAEGTTTPGGLLRFGCSRTDPEAPFAGSWRVQRYGEIRLLDTAGGGWTKSAHSVYVSDGKLTLLDSFATTGHLQFGQWARIEVARGKSAAFSVAAGD